LFGAGQYAPGSAPGKQLLARELTHVVQQGGTVSTVQRKPVEKPYRAQIVAVKETEVVQTCQDTNAKDCRTDVLSPGMEVTVTDEFVGGAWLFVQNLPEQTVKALHGQKWVYVQAKDVDRLPEAQAQPTPSPKQKSETQTDSDASAEQLSEAIYSSDREKVTALLNEGALEQALELVRRVHEKAEAKGQVSPVGYLGDDFSLDASDEPELRVAVQPIPSSCRLEIRQVMLQLLTIRSTPRRSGRSLRPTVSRSNGESPVKKQQGGWKHCSRARGLRSCIFRSVTGAGGVGIEPFFSGRVWVHRR
jgi:hypothetical protein